MQADLLKWIESYEPDLIRCRLQASDKNVESKDIVRGIANSLENEIGLSRRVIAYFSNPYQKNLADRLTAEIEKVNDIGSFDARQKNITIYYLPTILEINSALDDCLAAIPCQQAKSLTSHSGATIKGAIKPPRAELDALIKNLLDWRNKQPEFTTGIFPDEDRTLTPADKLMLARFADQAKIFLQDLPNRKNEFKDFATALGNNSLPGTLMAATPLIEALCELRNTLPNSGTAGGTKGTAVSILISLLIICTFVISVWYIPFTPFTWIKNHPHSLGIQGSIICLIPCLFFGLFEPRWRKWCWGFAFISFLVGLLLLL
jgi:hypothetical protein